MTQINIKEKFPSTEEKKERCREKKPKVQGTRYSCKHSTVRKKAGTTYSSKYSPKY